MEKIIALLSIIINVILFVVLHLKRHRDKGLMPREETPTTKSPEPLTWRTIRVRLSRYVPTTKGIINYSPISVSRYGANYTTFAAFIGLNYIFPYFMWSYGETYHCNTLTAIRWIGAAMCILLLLKSYWPIKMLKYFPIYWHATVMYVLPFSTTLSLLIMGGTTEWLINTVLAIMMLSAIVDKLSFVIIAVLGAGLGITVYYLCTHIFGSITPFSLDPITRHHLIYICIFSTLIGFIFFRNKKKADRRLETLELFGRVVGTEMSNILAMSRAYASNIQFFGKQLHIEHILPSDDHREHYLIKVDKNVYLSLQETTDSLIRHSERGIRSLHRMLATLRKDVTTNDFTTLSMEKCVNNALTLYNLTKHQQDNLFINLDEDFKFYGSAYHMQHLLFNLLDNAYKHSKKNCTLEIWLSNNRLYVKDNGHGIDKKDLPYIFDPFFTTAQEAIGLGLTFCRHVMETFGGVIICKSEQGEASFAEFILTFPADVGGSVQGNSRTQHVYKK